MRRTLVILLALPFGAASAGDVGAHFGVAVSPAQSSPAANLDDVVDRIMFFDRNADGKIEKGELIDRMQHLVSRGDADGDGALDALEIREAAKAAPSAATGGGPIRTSYQFPEDRWFPSRFRIDDAVDDLRLAPATRRRVMEVVDAHQQRVKEIEQAASAELLGQMKSILSPQQLDRFTAAVEGHTARNITALARPSSVNVRVFFFTADLGRSIDQFGLTPSANREGQALVARYNGTLRERGQKEQAELVERMRGILTDEERENFGAALNRRSATAAGKAGFATGGVISSIVGGLPAPPVRPVSSQEF